MDKENSSAVKAVRGRPRNTDKRQVMQQLMDAAEEMLREVNHFDLTERKIAAAANTTEAMIHYYFGGKDGLMFELILRYYDEIADRLKAFDLLDLKSAGVIRDIFKILVDTYYFKPWMARIVVSEFARGRSAIKDSYLEKFGSKGLGLGRVKRVFEQLIAAGICKDGTNAEYAAQGMYSLLIAPFVLAPLSGEPSFESSIFRRDDWVDYVADLFSQQLLLPK